VKRLAFFLIITLFAGMSAAGVKYVAVVETDVDASSGASAELNPAEVREITAELRRQATKNLPSGRYSVMTSETVQSMGGAVLEECADENCVITLGSKIGADYIVRGTVSKFKTMFTLAVELYETENGTLVVSSEAVRSENLVELLRTAAAASAEMYREFAGVKESALKFKPDNDNKRNGNNAVMSNKSERGYYLAPKYQIPLGMPSSWGGINVEGGWTWDNGMFIGLDISGGGSWITCSTDNLFMGLGISLGNVYDLGGQLQLVYGGSVGLWYTMTDHYTYKGYDDATYDAINYLAPFVKLRWKFVELTYRGLLGIKEVSYDKTKWDSEGNQYDYNKTDVTYFGWNNHQLMTGFYFSKPKIACDSYTAIRYQMPLGKSMPWGINLERGLVWGDVFFGIDISGGVGEYEGSTDLGGIGFSLGKVYDLWDELQFVYGGSVGFWVVWYSSTANIEIDYLAPFVKLRWKYIELMYRGLLGSKPAPYVNDTGGSQFGWNNHQLMLGLYFASSKRER